MKEGYEFKPNEFKRKTLRGLAWSFMSQGGKQACQFVIAIILARLLRPQDYGLLAMATVLNGFVDIFGDMGFSRALIYKQDLGQDHLSVAFWSNLIVGALLTTILFFAAPLVGAFYKMPAIIPIFTVLSFNFILSSFGLVQQALLMKRMNFKSLTTRDITATLVAGAVGIVLALKGFGVWSLVGQALSFSMTNGILLWALSPWRPSLVFSKKAFRELSGYGIHVTGFSIFTYLARNIDNLLIGKFLGAQALGFYTLAYKLMLLPLTNITFVITKVMFPALSEIQKDLVKVRRVYLRMTKFISLLTFPLMCGLFALAPELIGVIYGAKWAPVVPLVQVMCFCGMLQSIYSSTTSIFLSQGRSKQLFRISLLNCLVVTTSVFLGLPWQIFGVACFYSFFQLGWVFYVQWKCNRLIALSQAAFFLPLLKSGGIGACVIAGVLTLKMFLNSGPVMSLVMSVACGVFVFMAAMFLIEKKESIRFFKYLFGKLALRTSLKGA